MGPIIGIILILVLIGFFVLSLYMNAKIPRPEGMSQASEKCASCKVNCVHNPNNKDESEENNGNN